MKCLAIAGSFLLLFVLADHAEASLIFNGSFEQVPNSNAGAGLLPTGWFHTNPSLPAGSRASTYSNDGSYGLDPGEDSNFSGVIAAAGIRWVAGQSRDNHGASNATVEGEAFGTELTELLVPGGSYQFEAELFRERLGSVYGAFHAGGYQLFLSAGTSGAGATLLGALDYVSLESWQSRSLSFTAPSDSGSRPYLILVPYYQGISPYDGPYAVSYIGIDDVSLVALSVPSPVPTPSGLVLALSGLGSWVTLRLRRRSRKSDSVIAN